MTDQPGTPDETSPEDASSGGRFAEALMAALDKAFSLQRPAVVAHVARIRRRHPEATPAEIIAKLEERYLAALTAMGAVAGGAAAVPAIGTAASVTLGVAEIGTFLDVTVLFTLAVAEVHGVDVEDLDRRRTLVLAVLLGRSGTAAVEKAAGRTGAHWAKLLVKSMPMEKIKAMNKVLGRNFVTKYGTKQGVLVLGRAMPFGIGAAIGASGNYGLGYASVRAARRVFGPAPAHHLDARAEVIEVTAVRDD